MTRPIPGVAPEDSAKPMERYRIAIELMEPDSKETLDLGCSICELERFVPAVGVDVSALALVQAKRERPALDLVQSSSGALPFKAGTFGTVILLETLEHVPSEDRTIREVGRVLRDGGVLILSVPHATPLYKLMDLEYWLIPRVTGRPVHRHYSEEQVRVLLEERGLRLELAFGKGMLAAALLRWVIFPFDLLDFFRGRRICGPMGMAVRRLLNPAIDREFSITTRCGASLFVKARKLEKSNANGFRAKEVMT